MAVRRAGSDRGAGDAPSGHRAGRSLAPRDGARSRRAWHYGIRGRPTFVQGSCRGELLTNAAAIRPVSKARPVALDASRETVYISKRTRYRSRAGLRYNNQYAPATNMAPPTMFPIVTAVRLAANPVNVRLGNVAGVACVMSQKASDAVCFTINPKPMKYMLATACSNPAATKAAIGNTVSIARCAGSRLESDSQMARQTNVLQSMPSTNARSKGNAVFASAVRSAVRPI